jgi:hypothetical protein
VSVLAIVILVVAVLLVILFVGGLIVSSRHHKVSEAHFRERVAQADRDLATAAAEDRGWDRAVLDDAVRRTWAQRQGAAPIDSVALVSVRDLPGTDDDEATFQIISGATPFELVLSRTGDLWS